MITRTCICCIINHGIREVGINKETKHLQSVGNPCEEPLSQKDSIL